MLQPRPEDYQSGYVPAEDGTKLFWQRWGPPQRTKRAVVLLHDLKDHGSRYGALALDSLVPEGYAVYALDLRGHGQSHGERGYVGDFNVLLRDLEGFIRHVQNDEWASMPFILGHGVGGTLALLYATSQDRPIQGIAISAAWLRRNVSEMLAQGFQMADTPSREPAKARFFDLRLGDYSHHPSVIEALRRDPLIHDERLPARTALQVLQAIDRVQAAAKDVTRPLLVLHGAADRIAPIEGATRLHTAAGSSKKLLRTYAECGHDLWHEPEPHQSQIRGDLLAWLHATA